MLSAGFYDDNLKVAVCVTSDTVYLIHVGNLGY